VDLIVGEDSLGLFEKINPINMSPLVNVCGAASVFTLPQPTLVNCTCTVRDLEKALFLALNGGV